MSYKDSSEDTPRPTLADDRPIYRFQSYEDFGGDYTPVPLQNRSFDKNQDSFAKPGSDEKHLNQLSLGFKVYAAVNALFSSIPIIHLSLGIMMVSGGMGEGKDAPPEFFGWFFIIFSLVFILLGYALSVCSFIAGRFLKERRNYTFCFVMSCVNCAFMPLGTIVGLFGIILLTRETVKKLFQENSPGNQFN
jgi:hypothetical protein